MKKYLSLACLALAVMTALGSFCGCLDRAEVPGEEYILAARKAYVGLDSARVDVVNDLTGEAEQIFIYKYDEVGMMTYSYLGVSQTDYIAQYNNGYEQFTEENGVVTVTDSTQLGFNAYSRDVPYPMADEGLILFIKAAVMEEGSYIAANDMAMEICHQYDITKIDGALYPEGLKGFTVKYYFDGEGNLLYLREISVIEENGSTSEHSYTIYITERNEVESVPNLVKVPGEDIPYEEPPALELPKDWVSI